MTSNIITVYYEISGICNAKCPYCPTGSGKTKNTPSRFIPVEEFSRGLNRLYDLDLLTRNTYFNLFNWGDPLLHPKLDEILYTLKNANQNFTLSTNGSFLPKKLCSSLLDNLSYFRVSIPGFSQESYDKIHQLKFKKVLHHISLFSEMVPANTLEVLFFVYKFNLKEISQAYEYFNSHNIRFRLAMPHLMYINDAIEYLTDKIDPAKKQKIENDLFIEHIKPLILCREKQDICHYLRNELVIDEYSNILRCCALSKDSEYYSIGSLFELSRDEIFDMKNRGCDICSNCISAGVPYWYDNNPLLPELQAFNTPTYCYIDTGSGFSEKQLLSLNYYLKTSETRFHIKFDLRNFKGINSIRWDPVEGHFCHVKIDKIEIEMKNGRKEQVVLSELTINGNRISDVEFQFNTLDPWIIIPINEADVSAVQIDGNLVLINNSKYDQDHQNKCIP
jgi:MoaA/NifB/PqqE/SkfB family radical SAM enzyme